MGLREISKAAVGLSLMASMPISAAVAAPVRASQSLPQTAVAAPVAPVRAGADMQDASELRSGGWFIPLAAIVAIVLGVLVAVGGDDDGAISQ